MLQGSIIVTGFRQHYCYKAALLFQVFGLLRQGSIIVSTFLGFLRVFLQKVPKPKMCPKLNPPSTPSDKSQDPLPFYVAEWSFLKIHFSHLFDWDASKFTHMKHNYLYFKLLLNIFLPTAKVRKKSAQNLAT